MADRFGQGQISVATVHRRIRELSDEIFKLEAQRAALEALLRESAQSQQQEGGFGLSGDGAVAHRSVLQGDEAQDKLGPRKAIEAYVASNPGKTVTEIADALEHSVASKARDKRNVLRTTVALLVQSGVLKRVEARIYDKEHAM